MRAQRCDVVMMIVESAAMIDAKLPLVVFIIFREQSTRASSLRTLPFTPGSPRDFQYAGGDDDRHDGGARVKVR